MRIFLRILGIIIVLLCVRIFLLTKYVESKARNNIFSTIGVKNMKKVENSFYKSDRLSFSEEWRSETEQVLFWWDKMQRPVNHMDYPPSYTEPLHVSVKYGNGEKKGYLVKNARFKNSILLKDDKPLF